jgi:hypothetical protein
MVHTVISYYGASRNYVSGYISLMVEKIHTHVSKDYGVNKPCKKMGYQFSKKSLQTKLIK